MKLKVAGAKATGSAVSGSQQFSMAINAKAFHTLSATLYKDKYGAIIREVCSNAYDAHIAAGIPERPFLLVFPDRIDSELVIRDYGFGISPEDIFNVYCKFFESTKDDSNEAVGAFGLGSKTPFAYTDTFTVTSIHKGVKRIYAAFKDEGMPNIRLMSESETDEESGLEVCIPVRGNDISSFHNAVLRELRFFPVKPDSNINWKWHEMDTAMDFGSVRFYKSTDSDMYGFFVQIGPVGYRIDKALMEEYARKKGIKFSPMMLHLLEMSNSVDSRYNYGRTRGYNALLQVEIGSVEVQPSREGLHYTDETCQNIIDAVLEAEKAVSIELAKRLDESYAEGCKKFYDLVNSLPGFLRSSLTAYPDFETKYEPFCITDRGNVGVKWDTSIVGADSNISARLGKIEPTSGRGRGYSPKTETVSTHCLVSVDDSYHSNGTVRFHGLDIFLFDTLYFKDEKFAYKSRIREHDRNNISLFIEPLDGQCVDTLVAYFSKFTKVIRVSELPKNVDRKSHSTTGGQTRAWFTLGRFLENTQTRYFGLNRTLYSMGVESVFNQNLNLITEPTIVVRTFNNVMVNIDREKFALLALLAESGYNVIAIPKSAKYDNANLCEFDALTDGHYNNLEKYLKDIRNNIALLIAQRFVKDFNTLVTNMIRGGWLNGDRKDHTIDIGQKVVERLLGYRRTVEDIEMACRVASASAVLQDIKFNFKNIDEVFAVATASCDWFPNTVPSMLKEKVEKKSKKKEVLIDFLNSEALKIRSCSLDFSDESLEENFRISPRDWLISLAESIDYSANN